jgi:hypothetical protein
VAAVTVFPVMRGYRMRCCDCALVHAIDFDVVKVEAQEGDDVWTDKTFDPTGLRVVMAVSRDEEATAAARAESPETTNAASAA